MFVCVGQLVWCYAMHIDIRLNLIWTLVCVYCVGGVLIFQHVGVVLGHMYYKTG